ncbi:MAG TPA: secretin and TonB N-terminal domain-containing protein, partial [Pedobacter sp.]|nr:secretin and TonB N-terminal domain-containing protein [Pedobacter sp.]
MKNNYKEVTSKKITKGVFRKIGLSLLFFAFSINVMAQSMQKVSLNVKNVELSNALDALQKQVKQHIVYNNEYVNSLPKISLNVKDQPLDKVLEQLFANSTLSFVLRGNTIVVAPKQEKGSTTRTRLIVGDVNDERNEPLQRAAVKELNTNNGTLTNEKGHFELNVAED